MMMEQEHSTVIETNENNNDTSQVVSLFLNPLIQDLPSLESCINNNNQSVYDLNQVLLNIPGGNLFLLNFFEAYDDALAYENEIDDPSNYITESNQETIYVRVEFPNCFQIVSFQLNTYTLYRK